MDTIYAILEGKTADMATNFNKESFKVEYLDDVMNKDSFIAKILMNAFDMGGEVLTVFIQDKKIKQYTTITVSLDSFYSNEPFDKLNQSFSIRNGLISLVD
jgi:hypothetical protein